MTAAAPAITPAPVLFVTGAGGALGMQVLAGLLQKGFELRVLGLSGVDTFPELPVPSQVVWGDLRQPQSYAHALEGVHGILHMAALILTKKTAQFREVNVEGTRHLIAAAQHNSIRRFVLVSSASVAYSALTDYGRSKQDAESLVRQSGLDWSIARPTLLIGAGGGREYQLFRKYCAFFRNWPFLPLPDGGRARKQPVVVDVVAQGLVELLGAPLDSVLGKTYFLAGSEVVSLASLAKAWARRKNGGAPRILSIPIWPLRGFALLVDWWPWGSVRGSQALAGLLEDAVFCTQDAQKDFGYQPGGVVSARSQGVIPCS